MVENEGTTNKNIKLMLLAASYGQTNLTKKEINKPTIVLICGLIGDPSSKKQSPPLMYHP